MTDLDDVTSRLWIGRGLELGPRTTRSLRRSVVSSELERVRRGVFRTPDKGSGRSADKKSAEQSDGENIALTARERAEKQRQLYLDDVVAVMVTRKRMPVLSHRAALAVWNLPVSRPWPHTVDILVGPSSNLRSKNGVRVHRDEFGSGQVVEHKGFLVTTPVRTIIDLARDGDFEGAVVALDHALSPRLASVAQRISKDDAWACLDALASSRGRSLAERVIEFGRGESGSPGESVSRIGIHVLGFAVPQLQVVHASPRGGYYETDFEWVEYQQIGEFDGLGKYLKAAVLQGQDPGYVVHKEKLREDDLRAEGNGMTRWGWPEARKLPTLRAMLLRAGVPIVRRPMRLPDFP